MAEARGVGRWIRVDVNASVVSAVARDHRLPSHRRVSIHIVREIALADARISNIQDHVDIQLSVLGERTQVGHINAEVEIAVTAPSGRAAVVRVKSHDIPR